jgi:hypothetical protein
MVLFPSMNIQTADEVQIIHHSDTVRKFPHPVSQDMAQIIAEANTSPIVHTELPVAESVMEACVVAALAAAVHLTDMHVHIKYYIL